MVYPDYTVGQSPLRSDSDLMIRFRREGAEVECLVF